MLCKINTHRNSMIEDGRKTMVMCSKDLKLQDNQKCNLWENFNIIICNHVSFNVYFPSRANFYDVVQIITIFKMFKENMQMDL